MHHPGMYAQCSMHNAVCSRHDLDLPITLYSLDITVIFYLRLLAFFVQYTRIVVD